MAEWCIPFWVTLTLTLTSGLISRFFLSGAYNKSYITANFPQMCLMLDQFLWGHSSHVCDISCFKYYLESNSSYACKQPAKSVTAVSWIVLQKSICICSMKQAKSVFMPQTLKKFRTHNAFVFPSVDLFVCPSVKHQYKSYSLET